MLNLSVHKLAIFLVMLSVITLGTTYYIEHILMYKPCNLCLIERIPYWVTLILSLIILTLKKFQRILISFILVSFVLGVIVSFYHVGIEQGFFDESLVCLFNTNENLMNTEDLLASLQNNSVSCKNVDFRIFTFSLATINLFISLGVSVIITKILFNYEKNKY